MPSWPLVLVMVSGRIRSRGGSAPAESVVTVGSAMMAASVMTVGLATMAEWVTMVASVMTGELATMARWATTVMMAGSVTSAGWATAPQKQHGCFRG